jgi:hypothetical protein
VLAVAVAEEVLMELDMLLHLVVLVEVLVKI